MAPGEEGKHNYQLDIKSIAVVHCFCWTRVMVQSSLYVANTDVAREVPWLCSRAHAVLEVPGSTPPAKVSQISASAVKDHCLRT